MLNPDPKQRLSAFQVLSMCLYIHILALHSNYTTFITKNASSVLFQDHPWIKEDGEAPDTPLDNAVLDRLKQFKAMNQFKKVALRVIKMKCQIIYCQFSNLY